MDRIPDDLEINIQIIMDQAMTHAYHQILLDLGELGAGFLGDLTRRLANDL